MRRGCIDATAAKDLGGRVNDHLRYKLVTLRVQKTVNFFRGPTQPSKECVAKFVRNRGWSDHARIVDYTMLAWKPSNTEVRRRLRSHGTDTQADLIETDFGRGVSMFFCKLTSIFVNTSKINEYICTQEWPFLQVREKIMFENGSIGRGVVTTAAIKESEIVCDYHTDLVIDQTLLRERTNTQYVLDCGDFVLDATAETCKCHPGRRSFGRLLNYRPSNNQECNLRMKRANICGKEVVLFIAKRSIDVLEELCFDYNDPACRVEFCRQRSDSSGASRSTQPPGTSTIESERDTSTTASSNSQVTETPGSPTMF